MHMSYKFLPHLSFEPPLLRQVSLKIAKVKGINLGQGVCLLPTPEEVQLGAINAINDGHNKYPPSAGIPDLREAVSKKLKKFNRAEYSADEVVITSGSTGAFEIVTQTFIGRGDEVVAFTPFYPYHEQMVARQEGVVRYVPLTGPKWNFDKDQFSRAMTSKTKLVVIITPHNPTGKVFSHDELEFMGLECKRVGAMLVTDEVYEYMTYDGHSHVSPASIPSLKDVCITMGSYSKTFSITGWRVGYLASTVAVVEALRVISDQIYIGAPTPLQYGVLNGLLNLGDGYYESLRSDFERKRRMLKDGLSSLGIAAPDPEGSYFTLGFTKEAFPQKTSEEVNDFLIEKFGVGGVPGRDFIKDGGESPGEFIRFCYAVSDETLEEVQKRFRK